MKTKRPARKGIGKIDRFGSVYYTIGAAGYIRWFTHAQRKAGR